MRRGEEDKTNREGGREMRGGEERRWGDEGDERDGGRWEMSLIPSCGTQAWFDLQIPFVCDHIVSYL